MSDKNLSAFESSEWMFDALQKPIELWEKLMEYLSCNPISQWVITSVRNILG